MLTLEPLTLYEFLSSLISILGFISVIVTVYFLIQQTRAATEQTKLASKSMQETLFDTLYSRQHELTKIFIEHPEMYKYFYSGQELPQLNSDETNHIERARIYAIGEYILDFFVTISIFKQKHPDMVPSKAWSNYVEMMFANSPVLRELSLLPFYKPYFQEIESLVMDRKNRQKTTHSRKK